VSLRGHCHCHNIEVLWQTNDHSLVPRACGCGYCTGREAAWVSKSGTRFRATVHRANSHRVVRHGSGQAAFHECTGCDSVVFVTAEVEGTVYGVLNARFLDNPMGFADPVPMDFSGQGADEKRERWQRNWCAPVKVIVGQSQ